MKYFWIAIVSSFYFAAGTETAFSQQYEIGFKGGVNIYSLNFETNYDTRNQSGLHYGFIGRFHPDQINPITIQTEVFYSPQGVNLKSENSLIRLDQINVPILFQYRFNNDMQVHAGPQLGFLMNAWADSEGATYDIKKKFRKMDIGLSAGLSYPLTPNGIGIDIRYNLGLSKISTDNLYKSRNNGFQIGMYYLFDFGKELNR